MIYVYVIFEDNQEDPIGIFLDLDEAKTWLNEQEAENDMWIIRSPIGEFFQIDLVYSRNASK